MKLSILMLSFLSITVFACGSSSNTGSSDQNPHIKMHEDMHSEYREEINRKTEATGIPSIEENLEAKIVSDTSRTSFLDTKWQNGVIFFALGSEPSWSMDINKNNHVEFTAPDGKQFVSDSIAKFTSTGTKSTGYRSSNEMGELMIRLSEDTCSDTMSDESFSFQVSADVKLKGEKEFTRYQGCGDYVPDQQLHGKWRIVKADTLLLGADQFENKIPELNIDAYKGQVFGNDGCNSFMGQIKFRDKEIIFGMLAETMMACPNMDISSIITRAFSDKKLTYVYKKDLFFYEGDKEVMMLTRTD